MSVTNHEDCPHAPYRNRYRSNGQGWYNRYMKVHTFRLTPGSDLKKGIETYMQTHSIRAGAIITCVGGLRKASLRMAGAKPDQQDIRTYNGDYEIVSLVGMVGSGGMHVHMAISDMEGRVFGGHVKGSSIVDPTAEITIVEDESAIYERHYDGQTGFEELQVKAGSRASTS